MSADLSVDKLGQPALELRVVHADGHDVAVWTDEELFKVCGTRIAFTGRKGGVSQAPYDSFNLSPWTDDKPENIDENRRILCRSLGAGAFADRLVNPHQVHGSDVLVVGCDVFSDASKHPDADAIVCSKQQVPALILSADCVPLILVAPGGAFALVHAGWRGALAAIAGLALDKLVSEVGCAAADVNAYIGPHIRACCYEVGDDIVGRFVERFGPKCQSNSGNLDLSYAVAASLMTSGAIDKHIFDVCVCTCCSSDICFSHRAEHAVTGRQGAFAMRT